MRLRRLRSIVYRIRRYFHWSVFTNEMRLDSIGYLIISARLKLRNIMSIDDLRHIHECLEVADMLATRGSHFLELNAGQIYSTIETAKISNHNNRINKDLNIEASK